MTVDLSTNIRKYVYDIDQTAGYPSDGIASNLSKATTKRELLTVGDIPKNVFKMNNMNLVYGPTNSATYCEEMLNAPTLDDILTKVKEKLIV